jgi:hypothetical protein
MAGRGITIRIDRLEAIRILGASMREKTQAFERAKKSYPHRFAQAKKKVVARFLVLTQQARSADTSEKLLKLASSDPIEWTQRKDFTSPPQLNLCREKQLLLMLQNDVRKVVPINSNHELWAILQGKCEPVQ